MPQSPEHPGRARPSADPYRDTDVIDSRAARFSQGVTGVVALLGAAFGWPLAWALMSAQLLLSLTAGRRYCLPCLAYFGLLQPRFGEGPLEDSRPPRLANMIGTAVLGAAAAAWWLGAEAVGTAFALLVAALALLSAGTGLCVGCEIYRLGARLRGISPRRRGRIDPADLAALDGHRGAYVESATRCAPSAASGSGGCARRDIDRSSPSTSGGAPTSRASTGSRSCPPSSPWTPTGGCWTDSRPSCFTPRSMKHWEAYGPSDASPTAAGVL